jgi:hypothetical protein
MKSLSVRMSSPLMWGIVLVLLVGTDQADAGRRNRGMGYGLPEDFGLPQIRSPWGVGGYFDFGAMSFQSGAFDELLETGPTVGLGAQWKAYEYSGDLLPPSETHFNVGYRYAYFKGDPDFQLVSPGGFIGDVNRLRLHLAEAGATQRFDNMFLRGHGYLDFGAVLGLGVASGSTTVAALNPADTLFFVQDNQETGFVTRAELNSGVGVQFDYVSVDGTVFAGLTGTNALTDQFQSNTDVGIRLNITIFLDPK